MGKSQWYQDRNPASWQFTVMTSLPLYHDWTESSVSPGSVQQRTSQPGLHQGVVIMTRTYAITLTWMVQLR